MKNTKFSKIALLVLSVAILVGCALAFSASAEEAPADNAILAQNLVYGDKVAVAYAINASIEDAAAGKVTVNYYWEGASDNVKKATYISDSTYKKDGVEYPVFITEGVAPKELAKVAYATTDGENYKTYSAAEYLYVRLYEDGFTFKTEDDGKDNNRKLLYQHLLSYGAQAQIIFNHKADKLVTDYSIAYTTSDLINFGGNSYVFGYGEITIDATVIGDGTIVGWNVTDGIAGGTTYATDEVVHSLTGTFNVEPIFGVHECEDTDPADHVCDSCGEKTSDCATVDGDHICDLCGKVATKCADGNADGKCDTCGAYTFSVDKMTSGTGVSIYNVTMKDTSNVDERNYIDNSTARAYAKAAFLSLADADPSDATNRVLKISSATVNSAKLSTLTFAPDERVADGTVYVLEADLSMLGDCTNNGRPYIEAIVTAENGSILKNITALYSGAKVDGYVSNFKLAGIASTDAKHYLDPGEWGRVRFLYSNGKYYTYYSFDDGLTWVAGLNGTYSGTISELGFRFNVYNCTGTTLVDNVLVYKTDSISMNVGGEVINPFGE